MSEVAAATTFPRSLDEIRIDAPDAPPHVPKDRIVDIGFAMGGVPNDLVDPYEPFQWLNGPDIPRLLFNKPSGNPMGAAAAGGGMMQGNWVATHYEDIDRIYCDNEHFSNKGTAEFQRLIGETFPSIPLGDRSARPHQVPDVPDAISRPRVDHPGDGAAHPRDARRNGRRDRRTRAKSISPGISPGCSRCAFS